MFRAKVGMGGVNFGTARWIMIPQGTTRLLDYTSNHLPLCSLTENMVKRNRYATNEVLDNNVWYPCVKRDKENPSNSKCCLKCISHRIRLTVCQCVIRA